MVDEHIEFTRHGGPLLDGDRGRGRDLRALFVDLDKGLMTHFVDPDASALDHLTKIGPLEGRSHGLGDVGCFVCCIAAIYV